MPHSVVGGNFRDVFDYKDKVYAVDSLEHMTMGNTTLYEVSQDGSMNVIYDVVTLSGWKKMMLRKRWGIESNM